MILQLESHCRGTCLRRIPSRRTHWDRQYREGVSSPRRPGVAARPEEGEEVRGPGVAWLT